MWLSVVRTAQVVIVVTVSVSYVCYIRWWRSDNKYFGKAKNNVLMEGLIMNVKKK